jgi:hypothetical protein
MSLLYKGCFSRFASCQHNFLDSTAAGPSSLTVSRSLNPGSEQLLRELAPYVIRRFPCAWDRALASFSSGTPRDFQFGIRVSF